MILRLWSVRVTMAIGLATTLLVPNVQGIEPDTKPAFKIVQLGDSYSAGNGARNNDTELSFNSVKECYRSTWNWGNQYANSLTDKFSVIYVNRACSGGTLADILTRRTHDMGSLPRVLGNCPTPEYPDEEIIQDNGLTCDRSLNAQIEAVDETADLIFLTTGANDLRIDNIIKSCLVVGFRDPQVCRDSIIYANNQLATIGQQLRTTLDIILSKTKPQAKIVLVSYPHLIMNTTYVINKGLVKYDAGKAIRDIMTLYDNVQQGVVDAVNEASGEEDDVVVFYDKTKSLFSLHEPSPSAATKNGDRWMNEIGEGSIAEWHVFNQIGHRNLALDLALLQTFGSIGGDFKRSAYIDVAFVIDTTYSMRDTIAQIKQELLKVVTQLTTTTAAFRLGIVSYQDFPSITHPHDYPSHVDLPLTRNTLTMTKAINALSIGDGGDMYDTVLSGIKATLGLSWVKGNTKVAIIIGDSPAQFNDTVGMEPHSNLTSAALIQSSLALGQVEFYWVSLHTVNSLPIREVVEGTGGTIMNHVTNISDALHTIIDQRTKDPVAWFGQSISGKINKPVIFNAQGSYDPQGDSITKFLWDFHNNNNFINSTEVTTHTYKVPFNDYVILRVVNNHGIAADTSVRVVVNREGYISQHDENPCTMDTNGFSSILSATGVFLNCRYTNPPAKDIVGVSERDMKSALQAMRLAMPRRWIFLFKYTMITRRINSGDYIGACTYLRGWMWLARMMVPTIQQANMLAAGNDLWQQLGC